MTAVLLQAPYSTFFDDNGAPLSGGFIYFTAAGTDTPQDTYTSNTGLTPASNPVELDSAGRAAIWLVGSYKVVVKDSLLNTIRTTDNVVGAIATGDMTATVYDPAHIQEQLVGLTAVQTITNKALTNPSFTAGTASKAANTLLTGTNLTAAVAGSTEYDGKVQYFTPIGTQRGVVVTPQLYVLDAAFVGTNVNTAQPVFGVSVTLSSSTRYDFKASYIFSKSAGASAHTLGILFAGTATINNIQYDFVTYNNTTNLATLTAPNMATANAASSEVITGSISSANSFVAVTLSGTVSINAGGTFTPQYILSAAPGGAYSTAIGSRFSICPVGASGANISVGAFA